ncbi:glyoxal oxidase [Jaapia argillacea MUCL 33604]|uniref:Glyoxal oxidase n=1 Tax=Jaapia argillacea MUCL 33604 TaxID=933084 RepID=A0A067PKE2_9AGAM|nr:glyoxal oxidase [Jaapia argillacea MUCL 33604]
MVLLSLLVGALATAGPALAQTAGSFVIAGTTQVSAMMMFLGNEEKVYILDKAEGNAAQINGHPAWGAVWDIASRTATTMDVRSNTFCAAGMHLPNGSYATFGGNAANGANGAAGVNGFNAQYGDYDGNKSIRILNPCMGSDLSSVNCQWYDDPSVLSMQKERWYAAAEPLGDGTVVIIGGFVSGGYINRNVPNVDPEYEGGKAEPTYEFYPSKGPAQVMQFMIKTSGLNSYAHTFLMPSGKMLVQANISTVLFDAINNVETPFPDMPHGVARVYPASGAVAMLPLTPANNYTPTVIFCGGSDMPEADYGDYNWPVANTWLYPASKDCQRITPEPLDGSTPAYVQDDDMLVGRTMGQFIALPDQTLLVINGGINGTAGYASQTGLTAAGAMPFGMSLASGPVERPAIYNPYAPAGQRWSNAGMGTSTIARLYHSSALLLPDASILVAGSNPNADVNLNTVFNTEYRAEIFYPPYWSAPVRPAPTGIPSTLTYGGNMFNITVPASSYTGNVDVAAANTTVMLMRPGWTTHAMNFGQRALQLNNTYTVNNDSSITLHVAQVPPNPNIFQPGPGLVFVVIAGIPSNGTMVIVGNGQVGTQPTAPATLLPPSLKFGQNPSSSSNSTGGSSSGSGGSSSGTQSHTGAIVGGVIGAVAIVGILGAVFGVSMARRKRAARAAIQPTSSPAPMAEAASLMGYGTPQYAGSSRAYTPQHEAPQPTWNTPGRTSSSNLVSDQEGGEYNPYSQNK